MANPLFKIGDEELKSKLNAVKAMIRREQKSGRDTIDIEKELCWLEREHEWRQIRKFRHEEYIAPIRAEQERMALEEKEAEYESYKFDNDVSDCF